MVRATKIILVTALIYLFWIFTHAVAIKTATVSLLLQRENIHNVIIDDTRGVIYFERVTAKGVSSANLPYADPMSVNSALKKIYVVPINSNVEARPLFNQAEEYGYYFASTNPWSPCGRYLVIYRFINGRAQPGVFDLHSSRANFFDIEGRYDPARASIAWLSNEEFAVFADEDSKPSWFSDIVTSARSLVEARESGWSKGLVTSEIVGSGKYRQRSEPDTYDLVTINITSGGIKRIAKGIRPILITPRTAVEKVIISELLFNSKQKEFVDQPSFERVLSIINLDSGKKTPIDPVGGGKIRVRGWSDSGRYFLVENTIEGGIPKKHVHAYFIFDTHDAEVIRRLPEGGVGYVWAGDRLVYSVRSDGWAEDLGDIKSNLRAFQMPTLPLVAASEHSLFYLEDGDLWRGGLDGTRENLTHDFPYAISLYENSRGPVLSLTQSSSEGFVTSALDELQFVTEVDGKYRLITFSSDGLTLNSITFPAKQSQVLASSDKGAVFLTNTYGAGSQLQYVAIGDASTPMLLHHFNKQLADVSPAIGPIRVNHKGFDGSDVSGWLYLPPGASFDRQEQYPLIVVAYPGTVYRKAPIDSPPYTQNIWDLDLSSNTPMELYAAQGYAVLLPSIPLGKLGNAGEPMARMMPAILSALDSVINTGLVDSTRLALVGHSFGGYGALSVAVQTNRFDAIIAMASISNMFSKYGQFSPTAKINGNRFDVPGGAAALRVENGQDRMGVAPWRAPHRYIRNSPLFYVDKVTTPIMLIHGELDTATLLTQAEEIFTGLYRENKDALFIKYLGESHIIQQPQNQSDMWKLIFDFLEENGVPSKI